MEQNLDNKIQLCIQVNKLERSIIKEYYRSGYNRLADVIFNNRREATSIDDLIDFEDIDQLKRYNDYLIHELSKMKSNFKLIGKLPEHFGKPYRV